MPSEGPGVTDDRLEITALILQALFFCKVYPWRMIGGYTAQEGFPGPRGTGALAPKCRGQSDRCLYSRRASKPGGCTMDLTEMMKAGEQLLKRALEAVCAYHKARDSSTPPEEVERLRLEAESLMRAVQHYQQRALGVSGKGPYPSPRSGSAAS